MTTAILHALQIAKKAKEAGYTEAQADFQAQFFADILDSQVATKQDIKDLEVTIDKKFSEIELKISEFKNHIGTWLFGVVVGQIGLILTMIFKLIH